MASSSSSALALLLLLMLQCSHCAVGFAGGRKVGGRTGIEDVKTNKEVQELGKFSVEEYNKKRRNSSSSSSSLLEFKEVVGAERQVVSGIKYYLRIAAVKNGIASVFDAIVVVKPWSHSKELVTFSTSTTD